MRLFSALLILGALGAPQAWANGGPVAWTGVTPVAALGLVPDPDVGLGSEDLRIALGEDFNSFRVHATYELRNGGPAKTVLFGVPLIWAKSDPGGSDIDNGATASAGKVAGKISLTLDGRRVPCSLSAAGVPGAADNAPAFESDVPDAVYRINAWCAAALRLPARRSATLVMDYPAELLYTDSEYSKSALTQFGDRRLSYLFHPAGYWKGRAGTVRISVDPGPYPSFKVLKGPPGMTMSGRAAEWLLKDVDLRTTPGLEIEFPADLLAKRQILAWNRAAPRNGRVPMTATASGARPAAGTIGYEAGNVLDGRGETAWCVAGRGAGQWLQFRPQRRATGPYCRLEGIALAPGYLKGQAAYAANGKARKIRITDCEGRRPYDFRIGPPKDFRAAPVLLNMPVETERTGLFGLGTRYTHPLAYIEETSCFRLTILETEAGTGPDTCISEVSLVLNCN